MVIHSSYCSCPSLSCLRVGDVDVAPVKAASNLGVVFDDNHIFLMFASLPFTILRIFRELESI